MASFSLKPSGNLPDRNLLISVPRIAAAASWASAGGATSLTGPLLYLLLAGLHLGFVTATGFTNLSNLPGFFRVSMPPFLLRRYRQPGLLQPFLFSLILQKTSPCFRPFHKKF